MAVYGSHYEESNNYPFKAELDDYLKFFQRKIANHGMVKYDIFCSLKDKPFRLQKWD